MTRFYVEYIPDVGYMALAVQPAVIQATGWRDAYKNWHKQVGPAFDRFASPVACFALPSFMQDWPDGKVIEHYRKHEFDGTYIAPENNPFHRFINFFKGTEASR